MVSSSVPFDWMHCHQLSIITGILITLRSGLEGKNTFLNIAQLKIVLELEAMAPVFQSSRHLSIIELNSNWMHRIPRGRLLKCVDEGKLDIIDVLGKQHLCRIF